MAVKNGRMRTLEKRKPESTVLRVDDDVSFILTSLIDQNAELIGRLEHLESLKELAERTVLEAYEEAERIKAEAEQKAANIISRAEEEARATADRIISEAKTKVKEETQNCIEPGHERGGRPTLTSADGRTMYRVLVTSVKRAAQQLAEYLESQGEAVQVKHRDANEGMHQLWEVWSSRRV
jgi:vacuolar-type H+-ATPase subunit H